MTVTTFDAAAELRRLHEENKLLHERHSFNNKEFVRLHSVNAELLEALQSIMEMTGGYVPDTSKVEWAKARAAIAKATGATTET
jgi:hypothetical protein